MKISVPVIVSTVTGYQDITTYDAQFRFMRDDEITLYRRDIGTKVVFDHDFQAARRAMGLVRLTYKAAMSVTVVPVIGIAAIVCETTVGIGRAARLVGHELRTQVPEFLGDIHKVVVTGIRAELAEIRGL